MIKINKILLIDDDEINNFLNRELLLQMKVCNEVKVLVNGEDAISHVSQTQVYPELIFLDINMPVANGFEFLKNLKIMKLVHDHLVIVILTNEINPGDLEQLNYFGISEIMNKPLTREKVQILLDTYFQAADQ